MSEGVLSTSRLVRRQAASTEDRVNCGAAAWRSEATTRSRNPTQEAIPPERPPDRLGRDGGLSPSARPSEPPRSLDRTFPRSLFVSS